VRARRPAQSADLARPDRRLGCRGRTSSLSTALLSTLLEWFNRPRKVRRRVNWARLTNAPAHRGSGSAHHWLTACQTTRHLRVATEHRGPNATHDGRQHTHSTSNPDMAIITKGWAMVQSHIIAQEIMPQAAGYMVAATKVLRKRARTSTAAHTISMELATTAQLQDLGCSQSIWIRDRVTSYGLGVFHAPQSYKLLLYPATANLSQHDRALQ
jgi:hypothetical protein